MLYNIKFYIFVLFLVVFDNKKTEGLKPSVYLVETKRLELSTFTLLV